MQVLVIFLSFGVFFTLVKNSQTAPSRISSSEIEDDSVEEFKSMPLLDINTHLEETLAEEMDHSSDEKVDFSDESTESEDGSEEHLLDHSDEFNDFELYN